MTSLDPQVQVALIGAIAGLIGLVVETFRRKLNSVEEHAKASRHQVQNDHTTNLREDIDRVLAATEDAAANLKAVIKTLDSHGSQIGGLRKDMRVEREERLALSHRVDAALQQHHPVTVAVNSPLTEPQKENA